MMKRLDLPKGEILTANANGTKLIDIGLEHGCSAETIRRRLIGWKIQPSRKPHAQFKEASLRVPTIDVLAYVAGLLDGDGSIGVENIVIHNSNRECLEFIVNRIGGYIVRGSKSEWSTKPIFQWTLSAAADKLIFLCLLYPYFIIKREKAKQALLVLQKNLPKWLFNQTCHNYRLGHMLPAGFI